MLYSHPCNFYGHGPGPTIGLWNNQDKVHDKGDVLMSYDAICIRIKYQGKSVWVWIIISILKKQLLLLKD